MKVKCIDKWGNDFTDGKIYEAEIIEGRFAPVRFLLIGDEGYPHFFNEIPEDKFTTIEEWRESQINKIIR